MRERRRLRDVVQQSTIHSGRAIADSEGKGCDPCAADSRVPTRVVVADPYGSTALPLVNELQARGHDAAYCEDGKTLKRLIAQGGVGLVVLELRLLDGPATRLVKWISENSPGTRVVILTNHSSVATAVHCAKIGASGYLVKPAHVTAVLAAAHGAPSPNSIIRQSPVRLDRIVWEYAHRSVEFAGSITGGAKLLGLDRRSLRRMLARYAPPE